MKLCKFSSALCHTYFGKIQELDSDLRNCKEEFKEFERQDVKHREDLKHIKLKIKKLEDKTEKVGQKLLVGLSSLCLASLNNLFCYRILRRSMTSLRSVRMQQL